MAVPPPVRGGSRWTPARIKLDAQGHLAAKSEEGGGGGGGAGAGAGGGGLILLVSVYSLYIHKEEEGGHVVVSCNIYTYIFIYV
jgi:hypothetical protein